MSDAALLSIALDRDAAQSLFRQLYEALRQLILKGRLARTARLPASRAFAAELGVSRATVTLAYDQLIAEGYLESRRGSGVYVCDLPHLEIRSPAHVRAPRGQCPSSNHPSLLPASSLTNSQPQPQPQAFAPGLPDMRLFPYKEWGRCVARAARTTPAALIDGGEQFGDHVLRAALSRHLAEWRAIDVSPEQIIITAGAGDALELTARTLAQKGDSIALENPGYPPLRRFALSLGLVPQWLTVDHEGAVLPDPAPNQRPPRLTVLTPSHQFPLGGTMGTARRAGFLALAQRTDGWIIEDDFDSEFRYTGRPIPALAGLEDNNGGASSRVIYIGSLAKIFSKGLRLGFLVLPHNLIDQFSSTLLSYGHKASLAAQRPLANFIDEGLFHRHIRRMRRIYGARRRVFLDLLQDELGSTVRPIPSPAGLQIAVTLPPDWQDVALSEAAKAQGLNCPPLSQYYAPIRQAQAQQDLAQQGLAQQEPARPGLLMGFSAFSEDEMRAPMTRLAKLIREMY